MSIIDHLFEVINYIKTQHGKRKSILVSHVLVPFIVISFWGCIVGIPGISSSTVDNVKVIDFKSAITSKDQVKITDSSLFIFESTPGEYYIPMLTTFENIYTSLDRKISDANKSKLTFKKDAILIQTPWLGTNEAIALYIDGKPGKEILTTNGRIDRKTLKYISNKGILLAFSAFCVFVFSLGISLGSIDMPENYSDPNHTSDHC